MTNVHIHVHRYCLGLTVAKIYDKNVSNVIHDAVDKLLLDDVALTERGTGRHETIFTVLIYTIRQSCIFNRNFGNSAVVIVRT